MAILLIKSKTAEDVLRWMVNEPTDAQKKAGNYAKKTIDWKGLKLKVENPAGSMRRYPGGETRMICPYGYIANTLGADGDEIDVFLGPEIHDVPFVYVVQQRVAGDWTRYDEDKCMLGFRSQLDAIQAYKLHYDDDRFLGPVHTIPVEDFVIAARASKETAPSTGGSIA